MLLVDEIDSLFFGDAPEIIDTEFISAVLLFNKYKTVGMTATFRGAHGMNKMISFLRDSTVFRITEISPERDVSKLEVIGRCKDVKDIETKAVELAMRKQKEKPVIIILPTIADCERLAKQFEDCHIFGSGTVID